MAIRSALLASTAILSTLHTAYAQTWSLCNPTWGNVTCAPNPALGGNGTWNFAADGQDTAIWNTTLGPMTFNDNGAVFTVSKSGDAPTIQSNFYIMFGEVTVNMMAAEGQGIISSIVLESDDLDEVDWEFMGGNKTHVETNYFGKGNQTVFDRAIYYPMPDNSQPQAGFHNYTVKWTAEQIQWLIDGHLVRSLPYAEANGGHNFPQTPMNVRIGIWSGGDPTKNGNGTIEWAGGITDFKKAPWTMYVKSVYAKDYTNGAKEYTWTDTSGSWQSIKATMGQSAALAEMATPRTLSGKWAALSPQARTAIIACSIGGAAILVVALLACCIIQGRKGKKEKALADAAYEKEQAEFNHYRMQMQKGGFSYNSQPINHHQQMY